MKAQVVVPILLFILAGVSLICAAGGAHQNSIHEECWRRCIDKGYKHGSQSSEQSWWINSRSPDLKCKCTEPMPCPKEP